MATSSTEAELIALTAAAKKAIALYRLFHQLNLGVPNGGVLTEECDNRQTILIVTEDRMKIQTAETYRYSATSAQRDITYCST